MFIVYYRNNSSAGKIIRPTPFVSINYNSTRNKEKIIGGDYSITLNGILLSNAGSPPNDNDPEDILSVGPNYVNNPSGNYDRPDKEIINFNNKAYSIFQKQQALRALFAHDGQKMEFSSIRNDEPMIYFYPSVESISFEEGTYVDFCRYTINLVAPIIFSNNGEPLDLSASLTSHISDYSDTWSLEVDDSFGKTNPSMDNAAKLNIVPKFYRITRNVSANGKTVYLNDNRYEAWEQAKNFVKKEILRENTQLTTNTHIQFPSSGDINFGAGIFDILKSDYNAFNHIRSENIDKTAGTYSLSDSWILAPTSENAIENYEISASKSQESSIQSVTITGTVKGLSPNTAEQYINNIKYNNALAKFNIISDNSQFGINSSIFKRATKMLLPIHTNATNPFLNSVPASVNVTFDQFNGEIKYDVTYDTKPLNFNGSIVINDTYPGDVYSIAPVINRLTGPIFQYIGGRTEYQRSLNIDLNVDRSQIHYNRFYSGAVVSIDSIKESYIYSKPSMSPRFRDNLKDIVLQCSPSGDPGIRKYFVNPISETWDARTGKYSLQISWVYELQS